MELGLTGKAQEAIEPLALRVTAGAIPAWLEGVLYRNGPGQFDVELQDGRSFTVPHWSEQCIRFAGLLGLVQALGPPACVAGLTG
jgi:hypothetical protein